MQVKLQRTFAKLRLLAFACVLPSSSPNSWDVKQASVATPKYARNVSTAAEVLTYCNSHLSAIVSLSLALSALIAFWSQPACPHTVLTAL